MNADERRYQEIMMRGPRANYVMYDVEVLAVRSPAVRVWSMTSGEATLKNGRIPSRLGSLYLFRRMATVAECQNRWLTCLHDEQTRTPGHATLRGTSPRTPPTHFESQSAMTLPIRADETMSFKSFNTR